MKYEELGLKPIQTENKQGNDKIRDIHFKINELLYFYSKKYADNITAQEIIDKLTVYAKELKELPENKKKDEILTQLRTIVKSLINFKNNFKWEKLPSTIDAIQRTLNYAVKNWVDFKEHNLSLIGISKGKEQEAVKLMVENNRIYSNILKPFLEKYPYKTEELKLKSFITLNNDIGTLLLRALDYSNYFDKRVIDAETNRVLEEQYDLPF